MQKSVQGPGSTVHLPCILTACPPHTGGYLSATVQPFKEREGAIRHVPWPQLTQLRCSSISAYYSSGAQGLCHHVPGAARLTTQHYGATQHPSLCRFLEELLISLQWGRVQTYHPGPPPHSTAELAVANHRLAGAISSHLLGDTGAEQQKGLATAEFCSSPAEKMAETVTGSFWGEGQCTHPLTWLVRVTLHLPHRCCTSWTQ